MEKPYLTELGRKTLPRATRARQNKGVRVLSRLALLLGLLAASPVRSSAAPVPEIVGPQRLMMIGGGPRPAEAMGRFADWAGGPKANILVVTWASRKGEGAFAPLAADLGRAGAGAVVHAPAALAAAEDPQALRRRLEDASGVFFSGGDQKRLMKTLSDLELLDYFRERYQNGLPVAGTSAGTAIMSSLMISGDGNGTAQGLGLVAGAVVDQHFLRRERLGRLIAVVEKETGILGVGIDEGSAVSVEGRTHAQAIGPSPVTLVSCDGKSPRACVTQVAPGARFSLPAR